MGDEIDHPPFQLHKKQIGIRATMNEFAFNVRHLLEEIIDSKDLLHFVCIVTFRSFLPWGIQIKCEKFRHALLNVTIRMHK